MRIYLNRMSSPILLLALFAADPLTLADAVQRAVSSHPTAASARAALRAAAEKSSLAAASRKPRIDFQESWVNSNNPVFVFSSLLTQRQFGPANFAIPTLNSPGFLNNFQSLITAEQLLFDSGRTRKSIEAASLERQLAESSLEQVELALAARTARAYLDAQLTRAAIPVAEQALLSARSSLIQAEASLAAGRTTPADPLSVKVQIATLEEQLLERRAQSAIASRVLHELIGAADEAAFDLSTPLSASPSHPTAALLRPELAQARLTLASSAKQTEIARLAWLPTVGLRLGFEADRQRFVTRAGSNWLAALSLKWTPYSGGADRALLRIAQASRDAAQASLTATERRLKLEVFEAQTLLDSSRARLATSQSAIDSAQETLRITRDRYEAGLTTITELLRAESALNDSRLRLLIANHGLRAAQLNLAAALGSLKPGAALLQ